MEKITIKLEIGLGMKKYKTDFIFKPYLQALPHCYYCLITAESHVCIFISL